MTLGLGAWERGLWRCKEDRAEVLDTDSVGLLLQGVIISNMWLHIPHQRVVCGRHPNNERKRVSFILMEGSLWRTSRGGRTGRLGTGHKALGDDVV